MKRRFLKSIILIILLAGFLGLGYVYFYAGRMGASGADLKTAARLLLFKYSVIKTLTPEEAEALVEVSCVRKCHGRGVIEKAVHTTIGWAQSVDRMRKEHGASLSGPETSSITRYLQQNYPAVTSTYPHEVVQKVFKMLWRSDVGEGDVYIDSIFATQEYFRSTGAISQAEKFGVENHLVFLINLTVHVGRLEPYQMDKMAVLKDENGREYEALPGWEVLTETSDNHHRQGMIRFKRFDEQGNPVIPDAAKKFQLVIRGVAGVKERVLEWQLPIPYPPELFEAPKEAE